MIAAWRKAVEAWCILKAERMFRSDYNEAGDTAAGVVCALVAIGIVLEIIRRLI